MTVSPFAGFATAVHAPRWLVQAYAVLAVAACSRAACQLATDAGTAPVAYALSALAGALYLAASIALTRAARSDRALRTARGIATFELSTVVIVGTAGLLHPGWFPRATVWSDFGAGYGLAPLLLPAYTLWRVGR